MGRQLHEDLPLGSYPDRPSVNQPTSKFYTDLIDICDGEVTLLRTKKSGQVWQMRCWIPKEKRHFKKSLRTKELVLNEFKTLKNLQRNTGIRLDIVFKNFVFSTI